MDLRPGRLENVCGCGPHAVVIVNDENRPVFKQRRADKRLVRLPNTRLRIGNLVSLIAADLKHDQEAAALAGSRLDSNRAAKAADNA